MNNYIRSIKNLFSKYRNLLPLCILAGFELWNLYRIFFTTDEINGIEFYLMFTASHLIGLVAFILCFVTWRLWHSAFKYVVGVTLVLGIFNLASFTPQTITQGYTLSINSMVLSIKFQPLSLVIITLYLLLNANKIFSSKNTENNMPVREPDARKIEEFKNKYAHFSDAELQSIFTENRFVKEAVLAAQALLGARKA